MSFRLLTVLGLFCGLGLTACQSPKPMRLAGDEAFGVLYQPPFAMGGGGMYLRRIGFCSLNGKDPSGLMLPYNYKVSPGLQRITLCDAVVDEETRKPEGWARCNIDITVKAGNLYTLDKKSEAKDQACVYGEDGVPLQCCELRADGVQP